jgi:hypothetical protein
MIARCRLPSNKDWHSYGGRGIKVCPEWQVFLAFHADPLHKTWFPGATLDRIDPDKDYSPDNCRWATPKEQANNKRPEFSPIMAKYGRTTEDIAAEVGVDKSTILWRHKRGRDIFESNKRPKKGTIYGNEEATRSKKGLANGAEASSSRVATTCGKSAC